MNMIARAPRADMPNRVPMQRAMSAESFDVDHFARTVAAFYRLSGIGIRRAVPGDFARLSEIQVSALFAAAREIYGALKIKRFVERHLRQTLALCSSPSFFVAESQGHVVGSGGWTTVPAEGGTSLPCAIAFHVDPAWGRRGIGRALLAVTEASARQAGIGTLTAFATLHSAHFFRKAGYAPGSVVAMDLGGGLSVDLIAMRKRL